ncbi:MAG: alpha-ketoacid dehydrogenase subunit beta [Vicinamibacteria bacterium]|nr:alpha-ketoacid dehydrogenase subunit beta [Vicinamibacteria bacterium]
MPRLSYRDAIRAALIAEMDSDARVFVMGEDVGVLGGVFRVTEGLIERFGEKRVIDTPVSESAIIGAAIGAALMGMRPVVEIQFADFLWCAYDLLVNYAATSRFRWGQGVPMVVRMPAGAGGRGGPFHSQSPEARLMPNPGLKIVAPATPADAYGLLRAAIHDPDPVLFIEHKRLYRSLIDDVDENAPLLPIGRARCARSGDDITLITYGAMVHRAAEAAVVLAREDVNVEILDLRTLLPLDEDAILTSARKTGRVLILHEATRTSGPGAEIAALIAEHAFADLEAPILRLAALDTPIPAAPTLEDAFLPQVDDVVSCLRRLATR